MLYFIIFFCDLLTVYSSTKCSVFHNVTCFVHKILTFYINVQFQGQRFKYQLHVSASILAIVRLYSTYQVTIQYVWCILGRWDLVYNSGWRELTLYGSVVLWNFGRYSRIVGLGFWRTRTLRIVLAHDQYRMVSCFRPVSCLHYFLCLKLVRLSFYPLYVLPAT